MTATRDELLSISEASQALRISRTGLYRLFTAGELAWVKIGAHRRIAASEIARYIEANTRVAS